MIIVHTPSGPKTVIIDKRYTSLSLWDDGDGNFTVAKNIENDQPHIGIRTDAVFDNQEDGLRWLAYNFGHSRQIWCERDTSFELMELV